MRIQSDDDAEYERAHDDWEAALTGYAARLDAIRDRMPPTVREVAGLCLHDAELLAYDQTVTPAGSGRAPWPATAAVSVREENGGELTLVYGLRGRVREHSPPPGWPAGRGPVLWLYEEVDLAPDGHGDGFVHRILLSDGTVLEVPFTAVSVSRGPAPVGERVRAAVPG